MTARPQPRRNPVRRAGPRATKGCTVIPDELVRSGVREIGAPAFTVLVLLLSHSDGWQTSSVEMSRQLGWGRNRVRISAALDALQKANRLIVREIVTADGGGRAYLEYWIRNDGGKFSDGERHELSRPLVLDRKGCTKTVQGDDAC